jgi:hypothetical protein
VVSDFFGLFAAAVLIFGSGAHERFSPVIR